MIEQSGVIIQAEQERADFIRFALVAKATDDAIGCAKALDLDYRADARLIRRIEPLGDNAVRRGRIGLVEPTLRRFAIQSSRREHQTTVDDGGRREGLKRAAKALSFMFAIASAHARIKRLYIYQWTGGTASTIFDSGLTDAKHRPRPGYVIVCAHLHGAHCKVKVSSQ